MRLCVNVKLLLRLQQLAFIRIEFYVFRTYIIATFLWQDIMIYVISGLEDGGLSTL